MYTFSNNYKYELIIKNSKFITLLYKIDIEDKIYIILNDIKKEYPDATHYCYGYTINNVKKASDDGEPSGTAGIPILKVIDANNLTNVLVVVVRYFGGIKLGANGLIRAYTKSVANAIKEVNLKQLVNGFNVNIIFNYNQIKDIDYLLKDIDIIDKKFDDFVVYNCNISNDFISILESKNINYKINNEILIEKDILN